MIGTTALPGPGVSYVGPANGCWVWRVCLRRLGMAVELGAGHAGGGLWTGPQPQKIVRNGAKKLGALIHNCTLVVKYVPAL